MALEFRWIILIGLLWVVGANTGISLYFRWRKSQVEQSLTTATILLSESCVRVRYSSYAFFGFGVSWARGDIFLTSEDIVIVNYYRMLSFLASFRFYQPHVQVLIRDAQAPPRKGVSRRITPTEAISAEHAGLKVKTRRGPVTSTLRISVSDPGRWITEIRQVQNAVDSQSRPGLS